MRACTSERGPRASGVLAALATAIALVLWPAPALACAVCGAGGTGDNAWAYTVMSVVLSLLPLAMIGGTVYWVARRQDAADVPEHQDPVQFRSAGDR
jgi:hypothetical protein